MKKKILLIEDDFIIRENIAELIELTGFEVETAENGLIGVEKAKEFEPDLIVCDVMMPELDGYGVLYILNQDSKTATIPFIFLTSKSEKEDFRKGMDLGADDYLFKPFDSIELIKAIENRLKKNELIKKQFEPNSDGVKDFLNEANKVVSLEDIKDKSNVLDFKAKEIIYKENEPVNYVYFIEYGSVKTYKFNTDGKEYITSIYTNDQFFGYQPIFEDKNHEEVAEVLIDTRLIKISKQDFTTLVYQNREISRQFLTIVSQSLKSKVDDLILMAYGSVRKRVSKKLQELLVDTDEITIMRTDLAKLTGTTKESLTRTLTEFKNSKIIDTDGKKIILIDREKLRKMDLLW